MSTAVRAWLPEASLYDGVLARAFEQVAASWAAAWFSKPPPTTLRASTTQLPAGSEALSAQATPGLRLILDERAALALGRGLLQLPHSVRTLNRADTALLRELGFRSARDFLTSAAQSARDLTHLSIESVGTPLRFVVSVERVSFNLELDYEVAVQMRRALAKPGRRSSELRARREAVAAQTINVGALVGAGQLTLAELHLLERGDVIVLDRGPSEALPLTVNGVAGDVPACALYSDKERLMLRLQPTEKMQ